MTASALDAKFNQQQKSTITCACAERVTVNVCVYEHGREEIVIVGVDPLFKNLNLGQVQSMLPFESMSITFTGC